MEGVRIEKVGIGTGPTNKVLNKKVGGSHERKVGCSFQKSMWVFKVKNWWGVQLKKVGGSRKNGEAIQNTRFALVIMRVVPSGPHDNVRLSECRRTACLGYRTGQHAQKRDFGRWCLRTRVLEGSVEDM